MSAVNGRRQISSKSTTLIKWAARCIAIGIFFGYFAAYLFGVQNGKESNFIWVVLFVFVVSTMAVWTTAALKNVVMVDEGICVSHRGGEVLVPFSNIAEVVESNKSNGTITLVLSKASSVGSRIVFIPAGSRPPFRNHPVAEEIRERLSARVGT